MLWHFDTESFQTRYDIFLEPLHTLSSSLFLYLWVVSLDPGIHAREVPRIASANSVCMLIGIAVPEEASISLTATFNDLSAEPVCTGNECFVGCHVLLITHMFVRQSVELSLYRL